MEYIGERISVVVSFGGKDKLKPINFRWSQKIIPVKDVTYSWMEMEGSSRVYHFSVTDGATLYELSFNTASIIWILEKVEAEAQDFDY